MDNGLISMMSTARSIGDASKGKGRSRSIGKSVGELSEADEACFTCSLLTCNQASLRCMRKAILKGEGRTCTL